MSTELSAVLQMELLITAHLYTAFPFSTDANAILLVVQAKHLGVILYSHLRPPSNLLANPVAPATN